MMPLISIICCTHNRVDFVREHFNALYSELPDGVELIYALDNCSDATKEFLDAQTLSCEKLRILDYRGHGGLFNCRNFGLKHAQGSFVHFLDDDDGVEAGYHRRLCELLDKNRLGNFDAYITGMMVAVGGDEPFSKEILSNELFGCAVGSDSEVVVKGDLFPAVINGDIYFNCANSIYSRTFFQRHPFRGEFKKSGDWLQSLEASLKEDLHFVINESLQAKYVIHGESMSRGSDKSAWNARVFDTLLDVAGISSRYYGKIRRKCADANFSAGYAYRHSDKRKAFSYYVRAMKLGLAGMAFLAIIKLPLT